MHYREDAPKTPLDGGREPEGEEVRHPESGELFASPEVAEEWSGGDMEEFYDICVNSGEPSEE